MTVKPKLLPLHWLMQSRLRSADRWKTQTECDTSAVTNKDIKLEWSVLPDSISDKTILIDQTDVSGAFSFGSLIGEVEDFRVLVPAVTKK